MQYDFAVIGANGMQGSIVSRDLLESGHSVLLCAIDDFGMDDLMEHQKSEFTLIDLNRMDRVRRVLKKSGVPVVVNCAIDDFNLAVTETCLDLGMNYIDLGSEEDMHAAQRALSDAFRAKDILGITGIGSTPGITNIMLRYVRPQFDTIDTVRVGFAWDSNIPVFVPPFSLDAIDIEFTQTAKVLEGGTYVEKHPAMCTETFSYKGIGKQRTCYTRHIEHHTFAEYLKDAGIKNVTVYSSFPPHSYDTISQLIALGFTTRQPIELYDRKIRPLDVTIEVLRRIATPKGYTEREDLWLKVYGTKNGRKRTVEMDALADTLPGWEHAGCNIDTGFPASIVAQMVKRGAIAERGLFSPEFVIPPEPFFAALAKKKIAIYENGKRIN